MFRVKAALGTPKLIGTLIGGPAVFLGATRGGKFYSNSSFTDDEKAAFPELAAYEPISPRLLHMTPSKNTLAEQVRMDNQYAR
jgi:hypothetical protein